MAEGGGVGGDASSSSSSSVPSASSSSFAAGAQPLSLGLIGPSSSTQSPSSPWRSVPGAEPSTPSSPVRLSPRCCGHRKEGLGCCLLRISPVRCGGSEPLAFQTIGDHYLPRSSGSTEQDTSVPVCRHCRHLRPDSADPRPAVTTGATRRWDGEHWDAPRMQDSRQSRHHITTSSPRRVTTSQDAQRNYDLTKGRAKNEVTGEMRGRGDNSSHHSLNYFFLLRGPLNVITTTSTVRNVCTLARSSSVTA